MLLEGQYVLLRPLTIEDAPMTHAWRHGSRTGFLNPGADTIAEQAAWIDSRPPSEQNFVIDLRNGVSVGMLSLVAIDHDNRRAEVGRLLIGEPETVKGIPAALEALMLLYDLAFRRLKLQRIYGTVAADNTLMLKWHRFFGMQVEGRLRRHYHLAGLYQDAICVGLLEEEYLAVTLPKMRALIRASER